VSGEFSYNYVTALGTPGFFGVKGSAVGVLPLIGANVHITTPLNIPNATPTGVAFDTLDFDVGGLHSGLPVTVLTAPKAGFYLACCSIAFAASGTGVRSINFVKNSAFPACGVSELTVVSTSGITGLALSYLFNLALGDTVQVLAFQTSGAGLLIGGDTQTFFSLCLVP
jgi:hypothetical protein